MLNCYTPNSTTSQTVVFQKGKFAKMSGGSRPMSSDDTLHVLGLVLHHNMQNAKGVAEWATLVRLAACNREFQQALKSSATFARFQTEMADNEQAFCMALLKGGHIHEGTSIDWIFDVFKTPQVTYALVSHLHAGRVDAREYARRYEGRILFDILADARLFTPDLGVEWYISKFGLNDGLLEDALVASGIADQPHDIDWHLRVFAGREVVMLNMLKRQNFVKQIADRGLEWILQTFQSSPFVLYHVLLRTGQYEGHERDWYVRWLSASPATLCSAMRATRLLKKEYGRDWYIANFGGDSWAMYTAMDEAGLITKECVDFDWCMDNLAGSPESLYAALGQVVDHDELGDRLNAYGFDAVASKFQGHGHELMEMLRCGRLVTKDVSVGRYAALFVDLEKLTSVLEMAGYLRDEYDADFYASELRDRPHALFHILEVRGLVTRELGLGWYATAFTSSEVLYAVLERTGLLDAGLGMDLYVKRLRHNPRCLLLALIHMRMLSSDLAREYYMDIFSRDIACAWFAMGVVDLMPGVSRRLKTAYDSYFDAELDVRMFKDALYATRILNTPKRSHYRALTSAKVSGLEAARETLLPRCFPTLAMGFRVV